ncbi:MAG: polyamine aminopropyltransferase [bacterium]
MKWLYEFFPAAGYSKESKAELSYGYAINKVLFSDKSEYQEVDIIETPVYGIALFLDHLMMTTEKDEFIYHELLAHVPTTRIEKPERALIIGGGDGGIARELCKYSTMKEIIVAEIDQMVIDASRKYLPTIANSFDDPRVKIQVGDGAAFVASQPDKSFDVILVDSTEPIGPGITLYQEKFYRACCSKLKDNGQFAAQGLAPFIHTESQQLMNQTLKKAFNWVKPYMGVIPTYPTSLWLFFHASKNSQDINNISVNRLPKDTKYLTQEMLSSCYSIPRFVENNLSNN